MAFALTAGDAFTVAYMLYIQEAVTDAGIAANALFFVHTDGVDADFTKEGVEGAQGAEETTKRTVDEDSSTDKKKGNKHFGTVNQGVTKAEACACSNHK